MKFWYFSFDTLCFASSFILSYRMGAPLTPNPTGSPSGMPMANATAIAERHVYDERSRLPRETLQRALSHRPEGVYIFSLVMFSI